MSVDLFLWGGQSYALGEAETFSSVRAACETYADRYFSNGRRMVDGVLFPCWGRVDDPETDYVISSEGDGLTLSQVLAVADGAPLPFGWDDGEVIA